MGEAVGELEGRGRAAFDYERVSLMHKGSKISDAPGLRAQAAELALIFSRGICIISKTVAIVPPEAPLLSLNALVVSAKVALGTNDLSALCAMYAP